MTSGPNAMLTSFSSIMDSIALSLPGLGAGAADDEVAEAVDASFVSGRQHGGAVELRDDGGTHDDGVPAQLRAVDYGRVIRLPGEVSRLTADLRARSIPAGRQLSKHRLGQVANRLDRNRDQF